MMLFKYPYTNLYNLNLDWIIQAIKEMQEIVGPLGAVVNSVNGMTGDVEITKALLTQILGGLVETFNGRSGAVELTAEDVNSTLIDITWTSDPGDTIADLTQTELDEMYSSGKRVLIFVNNLNVADRVYFLQYYNSHAQPQEYTPTSALAGVASFNGQTGNVTATGADLATSTADQHTIAESLQYLDATKVPTVRTVNNKALNTNIILSDEDIPSQVVSGQTSVEGVLTNLNQRANTQSQQIDDLADEVDNLQAAAAYVEDGDTASRTYTEGQFVLWKGLLYTVKTGGLPQGTTISATYLDPITGGGLNKLYTDLSNKIKTKTYTVAPTASAYAEPFTHRAIIPWDTDITQNNFLSAYTYLPASMNFSIYNDGIYCCCNNTNTQTVTVVYRGN